MLDQFITNAEYNVVTLTWLTRPLPTVKLLTAGVKLLTPR